MDDKENASVSAMWDIIKVTGPAILQGRILNDEAHRQRFMARQMSQLIAVDADPWIDVVFARYRTMAGASWSTWRRELD